jgi:hypothetical protein
MTATIVGISANLALAFNASNKDEKLNASPLIEKEASGVIVSNISDKSIQVLVPAKAEVVILNPHHSIRLEDISGLIAIQEPVR